MTSTSTTSYDSVRQRATVEDRGLAFGDIYLFTKGGEVEARFCWTGDGSILPANGFNAPTRAQKNRAVRALAETPVGKKSLGLAEDFDVTAWPSADEEELSELRKAAQEAGLLAEAPTDVTEKAAERGTAPQVSVTTEGVTVTVTIER